MRRKMRRAMKKSAMIKLTLKVMCLYLSVIYLLGILWAVGPEQVYAFLLFTFSVLYLVPWKLSVKYRWISIYSVLGSVWLIIIAILVSRSGDLSCIYEPDCHVNWVVIFVASMNVAIAVDFIRT